MDVEKENQIVPPQVPHPNDDLEVLKMLNGGSLPISSKPAANGGPPDETLQQRFARFKRERQRERRLNKFVATTSLKDRDEEFRNRLREKFIQTSKKYIGIPYSAKYHDSPESEHYNAPLYLDCCGLVRRVLQDLKDDFGFRIGRWNQAYQFDTLSEILEFEQMKPGDLIFVEGTYNNPKARKQKYDILHIEIYLGGEQSIGARIQKGVIKIFDSYQFESKNYSITKFHFRSLEPWLRGELKLQHPEHWLSRDSNISGGALHDVAGIRSIFDDDEGAGDGDDDVEENDDDANPHPDNASSVDKNIKISSVKNNYNKYDENANVFYCEKGNGWKLIAESLEKLGWIRLPFEYSFRTNYNLRWVQARSSINYASHIPGQLVNHIPNNIIITSKIGLMETLRTYYQTIENIPDWFPESYRLDNPAECLKLIARHEELLKKFQENEMSENDCVREKVETVLKPMWILKPSAKNCGKGIHIVDDLEVLRRECFGTQEEVPSASSSSSYNVSSYEEPVVTISESAQVSTPIRGSALAAVRKLGEVNGGEEAVGGSSAEKEEEDDGPDSRADRQSVDIAEDNGHDSRADRQLVDIAEDNGHDSRADRQLVDIAQKYLASPLLVQGKKFDLRVYGLIARADCNQLLVYFHPGYARLSLSDYDHSDIHNKFVHLTNAAIQKKHPDYSLKRENSIWSFQDLDDYLFSIKKTSKGWVTDSNGGLQTQLKNIIKQCMLASSPSLHRGKGFFDLLGFDLMIDDHLNCHLLEINTNPALHMDNMFLKQFMPQLVDGAIKLVLQAHGRIRLSPLSASSCHEENGDTTIETTSIDVDDGGGEGGGGDGGEECTGTINHTSIDKSVSAVNSESYQLLLDEEKGFS